MTSLNSDQVNQARINLENAKSILLAMPANPTVDSVAASLAFYLALSSSGKQVTLTCPTRMSVQYNELVGVEKISDNISSGGGKNLIISFPYQEGSIEKVSYNIDNNTFNLVIEPREGFPPITPEMMRYSTAGDFGHDVIVTVGAKNLNELNQIYLANRGLFNEKMVINIDYKNDNLQFGKINLIDNNSSSLSELMVSLFSQMGLTLESDMATNLLMGITSETNNFSSNATTAITFETAALLVKNGARKPQVARVSGSLPQFGRQPQAVPKPQAPAGFKVKPPPTPSKSAQTPSVREVGKPPETPPDWLKPKIYKGSTLL